MPSRDDLTVLAPEHTIRRSTLMAHSATNATMHVGGYLFGARWLRVAPWAPSHPPSRPVILPVCKVRLAGTRTTRVSAADNVLAAPLGCSEVTSKRLRRALQVGAGKDSARLSQFHHLRASEQAMLQVRPRYSGHCGICTGGTTRGWLCSCSAAPTSSAVTAS